jgi:hypothetical protein
MKNYTISTALYGSQQRQKDISFFDRCFRGDVEAFLDFALILKQAQVGDKLAIQFRDTVRLYMKEVSNALDKDDQKLVKYLLSGLKETKYTQIGYSTNKDDGSGVSGVKARTLSKGLNDLHQITKKGNSSFLIIPFALDGISNDGASDVLTAILKASLIKFTQDLSKQNNWATVVTLIDNIFNPETKKWEHKMIELPTAHGNPVILYPKWFVNTKSRLDSIFTSFKTYLFDKYIKFDEKFKFHWSDGKEYITQKQLREILKTDDMLYKSVIRDYLHKDFAAFDEFESHLEDVEPLTDEELEFLQTCRVLISA